MATIKTRGLLKAALVLCVAAAFWNGACTTEMGAPPANIRVNPATVTFQDTIGNASPAAQTVAITTDNQDTVSGLQTSITYGSRLGGLTVPTRRPVRPPTEP